MRTVAIIQARMGSSRLPGKVLVEVCGKPLLQHMIERLWRCETLDEIVVAKPKTDGPSDPISSALARMVLDTPDYLDKTSVYHDSGSETDVLGRVLDAARRRRADLIVELTADCPLIDPAIVDLAVKRFKFMSEIIRLDFLSTSRDSFRDPSRAYPRGMDVRVFPTAVLAEVDRLTDEPGDDPSYREHVSLYIWERRHRYGCCDLAAPEELRDDVRLTVDMSEDLELVKTIFEEFLPHMPEFGLRDILELLEYRPELKRLNAHVEQKAVR